MIDFNHGATKPKASVPDLSGVTFDQSRRDYLGGSRLGEACARKLQFEYEGAVSSRPIDAKTQMIFSIGHAVEDVVAGFLRKAGYDLRTHKADGSQFGFAVADGRIRGHIDGVICGGPEGPFPYLWENKAVGNKYWQALVKKGVAAERPVYAGQIAIYQAYMDLTEHPALFSVVNRDTGEIAFERVPFDQKRAQQCSDRGVQVIEASAAGDKAPRAYANPDYFECRMCGYAEACWR